MTCDPTRCPLCGQDNRCAMELEKQTGQAQAACWCASDSFSASFSADLLAQVPAASQRQACICANCVASAALATDAPTAR